MTEGRRARREADYRRMKAVRQQEHEQELAQERERHRQHVEHIQERGRRIPTHAEIREQEDRQRRRLRQYYLGLFIEQGLLEIAPDGRASATRQQEIER